MSKTQLIIDVLLGIGVASALLSCIGVLVMKDLYERLHYMAPPAVITAVCFAIATIADKHFSTAGIKAVLITVVLLLMNAVLTHATARAARVRQFGRWIPDVTEVRGMHGDDNSTAGLNSHAEVDVSDEN